MITQIYIGEDRVELYKDESIEVVASVLDISDITKNTTDYSKSFSVPASKPNNKLFKRWFNANVDNTFDARTKVPGRIDLGGVPFKVGKWRLQSVTVRKGKPESYVINFFGELVSLVDTVKKDKISVLDLTAYDHEYSAANVKAGLTDSLFSGSIKYSMFAKKQYYYNSDPADNTQTDELANIAYNGGANTGIIWNDLQPSIKVIHLIEAIEAKYPSLKFTRDFFGASEFTKLYMWINATADKSVAGDNLRVDFDTQVSGIAWMNLTTDVATYNPTSNLFLDVWERITPSVGYESVEYTVKIYSNDALLNERTSRGADEFYSQYLTDTVSEVYFEVSSSSEFKYTSSLLQELKVNGLIIDTSITTSPEQTIDSNVLISNELPDITIIDFLKGLFQMYKLVVVPQDNGEILVTTLNYFYGSGVIYDITKYVDLDAYDVERGTLLNEISYKFSEPQTILNIQFEKNTGKAYGDEDISLEDANGEPLDGEELTFELPFEQVVYERLIDLNDPNNLTNKTNILYGAIIDEDRNPVNVEPHLYYNARLQVGTKTIGFINESGSQEELSTFINIPTHTDTLENENYSTVFASDVSEWDNVVIDNTLYKNHHEQYILDIFNIKKREFTYKAQMPSFIMTKLGLNDVLKIKGNFYRINKYNYNLLTDSTTFNLINAFDDSLSNYTASASNIFVEYLPVTEVVTLSDAPGTSVSKTDTGYGVGWFTATLGATAATANQLSIAFTENTTGLLRDAQVLLTQTATGSTITIYIRQNGGLITSDNNIITSDSDIITSDNG